MSTDSAKPADVEHRWYVIDARDLVLGRMASRIATVLRGKHKTIYTPHIDTGDYVIVVNADKVAFTGRKLEQKNYYQFTGYWGHLKEVNAKNLRASDPDRLVREAVKGMLPKNRLGRAMLDKLKVYAGETHPHVAQNPQTFPATVGSIEAFVYGQLSPVVRHRPS